MALPIHHILDAPWYSTWFNTTYYHLLYRNRDEQEAIDFLDTLVKTLGWFPPLRILDAACGKGRHAHHLARLGFDVTGTDLSANSITIAQKNALPNEAFFVHDLRQPFRIHYFDTIVNLFTSFGYFEYDYQNQQTMNGFSQGLKQGGCLVLDFLNPAWVRKNLVAEGREETEGVVFSWTKQIEKNQVVKRILVEDGAKVFHYEERVNLLTKEDFQRLGERAGLTLRNVWGSYSLAPYEEEHAPRMIFHFEKARSGS